MLNKKSLFVLVFFALISLSFAQDKPSTASPDEKSISLDSPATNTPTADTSTSSSSIWPYMLRMIFVLAIVIGCIYGLYALLKRTNRSKNIDSPMLKVLATSNLAQGRFLHIVSIGDKTDKAWLIASTDTNITLLSELTDKEIIDELLLTANASKPQSEVDFISIFSRMLGKKSKSTAKTSPIDTVFLDKQRDRLKNL